MSVAPPSGQDRIMIYGPKDDGTYVVEFRTAEGEVPGDFNPKDRNGSDSAFPGANALRAVCAR
jgi:hypothetical protein